MEDIITSDTEEITINDTNDTNQNTALNNKQTSETATISTTTNSTEKNDMSIKNCGKFMEHRCSPKNAWSAPIDDNTTTLIIGDSNMRLIKDIPADWEAHVFPGAYLSHASNIINRLPEFNNLRTIIVAVGINNRGWQLKEIKNDINKVYNSADKKNVALHFVGVSIFEGLSDAEKHTLRELNKIAKDKFKQRYIAPLDSNEVSVSLTDERKVHYDTTTVNTLFSKIKNHFLYRLSLRYKNPIRKTSLP